MNFKHTSLALLCALGFPVAQAHGSLSVIPGLTDDVLSGTSAAWTAEARIGNAATNGDRELGFHDGESNSAPVESAQIAWLDATVYAWELDYDAANGLFAFMVSEPGSGGTSYTVTNTGSPIFASAFSTLAFRVAAPDNAAAFSSVTVDSFVPATPGFTAFDLMEFDAPDREEVVLLNGAGDIAGGFTISGTLQLESDVSQGNLDGSAVAFQIKGLEGGEIVPEPSTYATIFGVLALALGIGRRTLRRRQG